MENLLNFINFWFGIALLVVGAIFYVIISFREAKSYAKVWIFEAERRSGKRWIEQSGEKKKEWVIEKYDFLPRNVRRTLDFIAPFLRLSEGERVWELLIQSEYEWFIQKVQKA